MLDPGTFCGRLTWAVFALTASVAPLSGQTPCLATFGTPFDAVVSVRGLAAPAEPAGVVQGGADAVASEGCADQLRPPADTAALRVLPGFSHTSYRSAYPFDRNNGSLWAGAGLSQAFSAGARVALGPVRLTLYPVVAFQENRDFTIAITRAGAPLRYPYRSLDWPQRLGTTSFWAVDPGQSSLAVAGGPARLALGTENLWWGPAERYPLLLSSTAPGFPHLQLGLRRVPIGIGDLALGVVWGRLDESDYFDSDTANDQRLLTLVTVGYRPDFLPGLSLGMALLRHRPWADWTGSAFDLLAFDGEDNAPGNALASATGEWRFPAADARVYVEWTREDYALNVEDLITEIDHSQAYTLGLEKRVAVGATPWRLRGELTHLGRSNTQSIRTQATYYTHGRIRQGHTQRGQLLGAAVGPGSNAQFLAADATLPSRVIGGYVERIRRDDDSYEDFFAHWYGFRGHDLEVTLGLYGLERLGPVTLQWDAAASRRKNRSFIGLDKVSWTFLRETNASLTLGAWWQPPL